MDYSNRKWVIVNVSDITDEMIASAIQSSTITLDGTTFATSDSTTITIAEGLIITGDLTVQGTTTSIDSSSINIVDRLVFEGSSADEHETTMIVTNPTADRTITIPNATGQLVLRDTTDTLTNKTIDANNNTITNIAVSSLANNFITFGDESSNEFDVTLGTSLSIIGGEGVDTTISGNLLTIAGEDATTSNKGVASFSSDNFSVSSGAVTIKTGGINDSAKLADDVVSSRHFKSGISLIVYDSSIL